MNRISSFFAIFLLAAWRMSAHLGLALASLLGLTIAIALAMSVPMYADSVYSRIFKTNLSTTGEGEDTQNLPPFSFLYRFAQDTKHPTQWENVRGIDDIFLRQFPQQLSMPEILSVRYYRTDNFWLFPAGVVEYADTDHSLAWVNFAFLSDLEKNIHLVEGHFPTVAGEGQEDDVEVLIGQAMAEKLGFHVGESYIVFDPRSKAKTRQIPIRVAGIWQPADPDSPYWFNNPSTFSELLLVPEQTYSGRISASLNSEIYSATWYKLLDSSNLHFDQANTLNYRVRLLDRLMTTQLDGVKVVHSPEESIGAFQREAFQLTIQLFAFTTPIFGLLLTFIILCSNLYLDRQRNEMAVLHSRGSTSWQLIGMVAIQALLLGLLAYALAVPLSMGLVNIIGNTQGFLDFRGSSELRSAQSLFSLRLGLLFVLFATFAQLVPAWQAVHNTIVGYQRELTRQMKRTWWQRAWIDVLLLGLAGFGTYLMQKQGRIFLFNGPNANNPFGNPLLFIVPTLTALALILIFLRLIPYIISAVAWIAAHTPSVGLLMAARHLSRSPGNYTMPILLLMFTLSLSAFTSSLAETLDQHLLDRINYANGADIIFDDWGSMVSGGDSTSSQVDSGSSSSWSFIPLSDYRNVPGVQSVTRVGRYHAQADVGSRKIDGLFMGVDYSEFSRTAFWRKDFAQESLGALMNQLAAKSNGLLVSRSFMAQNVLRAGDVIQININTFGEMISLPFQIVGSFDLFPSWYPQDGPLFVGQLDYLYQQIGASVPYQVWTHVGQSSTQAQVLAGMREHSFRTTGWQGTAVQIKEGLVQPLRQGLLGILSIGFLTMALLSVLGLMLYAFFSFHRRSVEMGILRAVGLSSMQMLRFLGWELLFLVSSGILIGTLCGAFISQFYIPFLQIGQDSASITPPYIVYVAWDAIFLIYGLFGLLFVLGLLTLMVMLRRIRIFEALKLGETL